MDENLKIREIYENADFPAAIIDSGCYVVWANVAAKNEPTGMFKETGIRDLVRFSDERALMRRLVKNGISATILPRQMSTYGTRLTLTPLPETGKEMLLTLSKDIRHASSSDSSGVNLVSCSVPTVREITARVCNSLELIKESDRKERETAVATAEDACSELLGAVEHMELFANLSTSVLPNITSCDTAEYFRELVRGISELLGDRMPIFHLSITSNIRMDHELVGRVLLMLVANAIEFSDGFATVDVITSEGSFIISTSNGTVRNGVLAGKYAMRPFVSFIDSGMQNDRPGIGLSIADMTAKKHGGSLEVSAEKGIFAIRFEIPTAPKSEYTFYPDAKSCESYIYDKFSPLYTELVKYAPKNRTKKK